MRSDVPLAGWLDRLGQLAKWIALDKAPAPASAEQAASAAWSKQVPAKLPLSLRVRVKQVTITAFPTIEATEKAFLVCARPAGALREPDTSPAGAHVRCVLQEELHLREKQLGPDSAMLIGSYLALVDLYSRYTEEKPDVSAAVAAERILTSPARAACGSQGPPGRREGAQAGCAAERQAGEANGGACEGLPTVPHPLLNGRTRFAQVTVAKFHEDLGEYSKVNAHCYPRRHAHTQRAPTRAYAQAVELNSEVVKVARTTGASPLELGTALRKLANVHIAMVRACGCRPHRARLTVV